MHSDFPNKDELKLLPTSGMGINEHEKAIFIVGNFFNNKNGTATTQAEELKKILEAQGLKILFASSYRSRIPRLLDTLWSLWRYRYQYQIVSIHFYGGLALILEDAASWLAKQLNKKIIFTLHGGAIPDKVKKYPRWYKRVLNRAEVITCPSPYLMDRLSRQGFELNFQLIENSIPLTDYRFHPKERFGPRLLWMRSFHPIYNPEMAVQVVHLLRKKYPSIVLYMAGSDLGYLDNIKKQVEELNLSRNIIFPGYLHIQDKNRLAAECDIYLCTNRIDNTPVSLIEMMAMGLPVVSTNVGGIPYMIQDEKEALLVASEDVEAMAVAIERIIKNPEVGICIIKNARKLVAKYSEDIVAKKWLQLIQDMN